jgi:hypothetical protein
MNTIVEDNLDEGEESACGRVQDPPLNGRRPPGYFVRKGDRPYCSTFARQAEMLTLFGATSMVLEDHFGVDAQTLQRWALEHQNFGKALEVKSIDMTLGDYALVHWFKDYWLGNLA